jgi:hypothetical protein
MSHSKYIYCNQTMKKLALTFALVSMTAAGAFADGGLVFQNYFGASNSNNAPVTDVNGILLSGPSFKADLLYGTSASTVTSDAGFAGGARGFGMGIDAGYFLGGDQYIPLSGTVFVRIVVWQATAGASWASATGGATDYTSGASTYVENGGTEWGFGNIFSVNVLVFPNPGVSFEGLIDPLQMQAAPEPASLALGGLGAAVLLLFRRRKQ